MLDRQTDTLSKVSLVRQVLSTYCACLAEGGTVTKKSDNEAGGSDVEAEAAEVAEAAQAASDAASEEAKSVKKKSRRKPIFVLIPHDIDDLSKVDDSVADPRDEIEDEEEAEKTKAQLVEMGSYYVYAATPGPGQKDIVRAILTKHNIDLKNIDRVRMFAGEKAFKVQTQYQIRF